MAPRTRHKHIPAMTPVPMRNDFLMDAPEFVLPEYQFHVQRARNRIRAVRSDLLEAEQAVERNCILHHRLDRVQAQALIAHGASLVHDELRQLPSQSLAPECRTQI